MELLSRVEAPLLVTVPPGVLPLKYQDADDDYYVSDQAYTRSIFGNIVAVPGGGVCLTRTVPVRAGVFIAAGTCDYQLHEQPMYKLHGASAVTR